MPRSLEPKNPAKNRGLFPIVDSTISFAVGVTGTKNVTSSNGTPTGEGRFAPHNLEKPLPKTPTQEREGLNTLPMEVTDDVIEFLREPNQRKECKENVIKGVSDLATPTQGPRERGKLYESVMQLYDTHFANQFNSFKANNPAARKTDLSKESARIHNELQDGLLKLSESLLSLSKGDVRKACSGLEFLKQTNLAREISAFHGNPSAQSASGSRSLSTDAESEGQRIGWGAACALSETESGMHALGLVARKPNDLYGRYDFQKLVLRASLNCMLAIKRENPEPPDATAIAPGFDLAAFGSKRREPAYQHQRLAACAKRQTYDGPFLSPEQATKLKCNDASLIINPDSPTLVDGRPDLAHLSMQERRDYSAARQSLPDLDDRSDTFAKTEARLEKYLLRFMNKKGDKWHRNPLAALTKNFISETFQFPLTGDLSKAQPAITLCKRLHDDMRNNPPAINPTTDGWPATFDLFIKKAALGVWAGERQSVFGIMNSSFREHEKEKIYESLKESIASIAESNIAPYNTGTIEEKQAALLHDCLARFNDSKHEPRLTYKSLAKWVGEAGRNLGDDAPKLLKQSGGQYMLEVEFPKPDDKPQEKLRKLANCIGECISHLEISSYVSMSSSKGLTVNTKNALTETIGDAANIANHVPIQPSLNFQVQPGKKTAEIAVGFSGAGLYFSMLATTGNSGTGTAGLWAGKKLDIAGVFSVAIGGGLYGTLGGDSARGEGVIFRKLRGVPEEAHGMFPGRASHSAGDADRKEEFRRDVLDILTGPGEDASQFKKKRYQYALAMHPDTLDVAIVNRGGDEKKSLTIGAQAVATPGNFSAAIGSNAISVGAAASLTAKRVRASSRRVEKGKVSVRTEVPASWTTVLSSDVALNGQSSKATSFGSTGDEATRLLGVSFTHMERGSFESYQVVDAKGTTVQDSNLSIVQRSFDKFKEFVNERMDDHVDPKGKTIKGYATVYAERAMEGPDGEIRSFDEWKQEARTLMSDFLTRLEKNPQPNRYFITYQEMTKEARKAIDDARLRSVFCDLGRPAAENESTPGETEKPVPIHRRPESYEPAFFIVHQKQSTTTASPLAAIDLGFVSYAIDLKVTAQSMMYILNFRPR